LPPGEDAALRERIESALARAVTYRDQRIDIGASVGHARSADAMVELGDLVARADGDMYQHKQERRGPTRE
jgi:predicted signal transduction protein with EAL and GGDEF domain